MHQVAGLIIAGLIHGAVHRAVERRWVVPGTMTTKTGLSSAEDRDPQVVAGHRQRYWVKQGDFLVAEWLEKDPYVR